jgi:hypothetical protein
MNTTLKKLIFWGALMTPIIIGFNLLVGGYSVLAAGPHGHGRGLMGPRGGGFGGHHMMQGPYHGGFPWLGFLLFLIIGIVILVLFVKWLKRKAKDASMQQFIDTSLLSSHRPIMNQNANILDQWEKNLINKKENE